MDPALVTLYFVHAAAAAIYAVEECTSKWNPAKQQTPFVGQNLSCILFLTYIISCYSLAMLVAAATLKGVVINIKAQALIALHMVKGLDYFMRILTSPALD